MAYESHPTLGLYGSYGFGDSELGKDLGGGALEGGARLSQFFGGGFLISYHRVPNESANWIRILIVTDFHILSEESKSDFYLSSGIGDGILNNDHSLSLMARAGFDYWLTDSLAASITAEFTHELAIVEQISRPSFSAGILNAGIRFGF